MIDQELKNYFNSKFDEKFGVLRREMYDFKQYMETDFTFKLIVGMSKVFVTKDEFRAELKTELKTLETRLEKKIDVKLGNLEIKLTKKIESLAAMIKNDIEIPHEKRLLALEARLEDL